MAFHDCAVVRRGVVMNWASLECLGAEMLFLSFVTSQDMDVIWSQTHASTRDRDRERLVVVEIVGDGRHGMDLLGVDMLFTLSSPGPRGGKVGLRGRDGDRR